MSPWRSPHDSPGLSRITQKRNALLIAISLSCAAFVVQVLGAWYTGSLALLGDTAHLFTDLFSLVMSLVALILATRPTNAVQSFGLYRLEVLAAFLNGILLLVVAMGLAWEGVERLNSPPEILALPLLAISGIGLVFNLLSAWALSRAMGGHVHSHGHGHDHSHEHSRGHDHASAESGEHAHIHEDRNLRSAMLHVLSDAVSSVGVMAGAVLVHFTRWFWVDAAIGLILACVILRWSYRLVKEAGHVLIEATPKHLEPAKIEAEIRSLDARITVVEDLHIWEITSRMYAATAEVTVQSMSLEEAEELRTKMNGLLHQRFGIAHVVLAIRPKA
jgi:cobalt-zinc-cadmium efflux system protein